MSPPMKTKALHLKSGGTERRAGIALVIVLGLLAVLTLFAVSFSISMRTERIAARSFSEAVGARYLIDAALADVMTVQIPGAMQNRLYPPWEVYPFPIGSMSNHFLNGMVSNYVSGVTLKAARGADTPAWIDLRNPNDNNRFLGQYTFLAVNHSGLLDANTVGAYEGNSYPRNYGNDPGEVRFHPSVLPEAVGAGRLKALRDKVIRFENVPELIAMGRSGKISDQTFGNYTHADSFHVFSRFPKSWGTTGPQGVEARTNIAYIAGSPSGWNEAEIKAVLRAPPVFPDFPIRDVDIDGFYDQMHDFASVGYVPKNVNGMSFKRVPMINEVIVSNTLERTNNGTDDILTLRIYVVVETYYPFPQDPDSPSFVVGMGGPPTVQTAYPELNTVALQTGPVPATLTHTATDYRMTTFMYQSSMISPPSPVYFPGMLLDFNATDFTVSWSGQLVDRVQPVWENQWFLFSGDAYPLLDYNIPEGHADPIGVSVSDPRLNYVPNQWSPQTPTPGDDNGNKTGPYVDELHMMFSAQRPFESAGELSYLLYDSSKPWRTIRLLGPDPDGSAAIVDRFSARAPVAYEKGLVNVNTPYTNVLASALFGVPVESYPVVGSISSPLSADAARNLAILMINRINFSATNMSSLASMMTVADMQSITGSSTNKFLNESLIRNSTGVLGVRQNLFTVLLNVRTFPDGVDPTDPLPAGVTLESLARSDLRAVAVLWRDPYLTGDPPVNEMFVRFFAWLTDYGDD